MNCIVADMFKTAYLCQRYKTRDNGSADRQGRQCVNGDVTRTKQITTNFGAAETCHGRHVGRPSDWPEVKLRPASAVSLSSSSDGASVDVNCSVGDGPGLGSVSSITESVNSWSFRYPDVCSSLVSDDVAATVEKSTLLVDTRHRHSQNVDVRWSCPPLQNVRSHFRLIRR